MSDGDDEFTASFWAYLNDEFGADAAVTANDERLAVRAAARAGSLRAEATAELNNFLKAYQFPATEARAIRRFFEDQARRADMARPPFLPRGRTVAAPTRSTYRRRAPYGRSYTRYGRRGYRSYYPRRRFYRRRRWY